MGDESHYTYPTTLSQISEEYITASSLASGDQSEKSYSKEDREGDGQQLYNESTLPPSPIISISLKEFLSRTTNEKKEKDCFKKQVALQLSNTNNCEEYRQSDCDKAI